MVIDENTGAKIQIQKRMTDLTEMIGEDGDVPEFLAHGITVEQSTNREDVSQEL